MLALAFSRPSGGGEAQSPFQLQKGRFATVFAAAFQTGLAEVAAVQFPSASTRPNEPGGFWWSQYKTPWLWQRGESNAAMLDLLSRAIYTGETMLPGRQSRPAYGFSRWLAKLSRDVRAWGWDPSAHRPHVPATQGAQGFGEKNR